jgi:hypothetical protein
MKTLPPTYRRPHASLRAQRGVILLFILVGLAVMLIGATALVRSLDISLVNAGNLAFRRDLMNQGERALDSVKASFTGGGTLATEAGRSDHNTTVNYRATTLATNGAGIPLALLDDSAFGAVGSSANDIELSDQKIRVRYIIDRLCATTGAESVIGNTQCMAADRNVPTGGSGTLLSRAEDSWGAMAGGVKPQVLFRVSVRVDGPRGTQAFLQASMTPQ